MPGFFICNNKEYNYKLNNYNNEKCKYDLFNNKKYYIARNTLNKFLDDKVLFENDQIIVVTEGILLNKQELLKKYNKDSLSQLFEVITSNDEFFKEFRGPYSGCIYYKLKDEWIVFTNHIGDSTIFYGNINDSFFIGSQFNYVLDAFNTSNNKLSLDKNAIYYMITYGYMPDNTTYAKQIKRLEPGQYIKINKDKISVHTYHRLTHFYKKYENMSENQIIDLLDKKFRIAVQREFEKDIEYNYKHFCDLSGGLDSRMTIWVAHDLGYKNMLISNFCQSNYLDEVIAKEIASYLNEEILVKTLDDHKFLYDVDQIIKMNYGLSIYSGISGGLRLLDCLNLESYGVEHTWQVGDAIVGTFLKDESEINDKEISKVYSVKLVNRIDSEQFKNYEDKEIQLMYIRGFHGALSTHMIRSNYTIVTSPFLDVDFLEFCLSIPLKYRINHNIYFKWILKKYPKAADFKWENINARINEPKFMKKYKEIVKRAKFKLANTIGIGKNTWAKYNMNPFNYWYDNDKNVQNFINGYFNEEIVKYDFDKDLYNDLMYLFENGNASEKTQILTAIATIKYYNLL